MAVKKIFSSLIVTLILHNFIDLTSCITLEINNEVQNNSEYIFGKGDDIVVKCRHNKPVEWIYPHNKIPINPQINDENTQDEYRKVINVFDVDHPAVGYYTCREKDNHYINQSIYLYVENASQLYVEVNEGLQGKEQKPLVIPCRPTAPNINVEFYQMDDKKIVFSKTDADGNIWNYDKRKGLTWEYPVQVDTKIVNCFVEFDGIKNEISFDIQIFKYFPYMVTPTISNGTNEDFFAEGYPLRLTCTANIETGREPPALRWFKNDIPITTSTDRIKIHNELLYGNFDVNLNLNITNLNKQEDEGKYTCMAYDEDDVTFNSNATIDVEILKKDTYFLNIFEENGLYNITVNSNKTAIWSVHVSAFPRAEVEWLKNNDKLKPGNHYDIKADGFKHTLKINNANIKDMGNYTIKATNYHRKNTSTLQLRVNSKPQVSLKIKPFNLVNTETIVNCSVVGYPQPEVSLFFKQCSSCDYKKIIPHKRNTKTDYEIEVTMKIKSDQSGYVVCSAENLYGTGYDEKGFFISDVEDGFQIWAVENGEEIRFNKNTHNIKMAVDDEVNFYCAADKQNHTGQINWFYNDLHVTNYHSVSLSETKYSKKIDFSIPKLSKNDSGIYTCKAEGFSEIKTIHLNVKDAESPKITDTNLNKSQDDLIFPNSHELFCLADGIPQPKVTWQKDGQDFIPDGSRIKFKNNNQYVVFIETNVQDEGSYQCTVSNKVGQEQLPTYMGFRNREKMSTYIYAIIGVLVAVTLIILLCLCLKIRKENELKRVLRSAGLEHFEKGQVESINPEIAIDEQAELLPYHKERWEIPREHIKLGKQLGAGAFGVVMKAEALGLSNDKETTIVAVKMVKKNVDFSYLKALSSELKIMGNLGQHINVVNLIGACTKNIAKGELLVVVEFCRFGNIHNYLLRHRGNFINQIDPDTNIIDYNICAELLERSFSVSSSQSQDTNNPNDMQDYRENYNNTTARTQYTATTTVCMTPTGQDEPLTSNNSVQPEWRSNYKGDYKGKIKPICTKDLITWAFQVARGMEYLALRKVLHGDLAARNILLSDNNIIKICDFGLAKQMYKDENYKKQHNSPLPIKWMAIESITDRVFSTQSDVWSFGIVMWELFSLAKTPYPGMEADEKLYVKLVNGYRMECPPYATPEIYDIMSDCWKPKPMSRPTFAKLTERIGNLLEQSVLRYYIDLNDPYLQMNTKLFQDVQSDYLQMASPPDFQSLSTPQYVNYDSGISSPIPGQPYMLMKPGHIFSPRVIKEGEVFTFDNVGKKRPSETESFEIMPMLNLKDLDNLSKPNSPEPEEIPSFSNPSYNKMPLITGNIKTKDNYINMPQNKNIRTVDLMTEDVKDVNNKNKGENHYVNSVSRDWERDAIMA